MSGTDHDCVGLPFCREMRVYLPRLRSLCARMRADRIQLVHLTTPGPMGLAALHAAAALDLPLIGSFHTDFGRYVRILGGSARLERWLRLYMRWLYGRCERILVPSAATGAMLVEDGIEPRRIARWARGVDAEAFSPSRRSEALRRAWGVAGGACGAPLARLYAGRVSKALGPPPHVRGQPPLALLYAGRVSKEKGLALLPEAAARLRRAGVAHRWIVVEFVYRAAAAGCFASLTQAFRRATPSWVAEVVVTGALPGAAHALQLGAYHLAGTVDRHRAGRFVSFRPVRGTGRAVQAA